MGNVSGSRGYRIFYVKAKFLEARPGEGIANWRPAPAGHPAGQGRPIVDPPWDVKKTETDWSSVSDSITRQLIVEWDCCCSEPYVKTELLFINPSLGPYTERKPSK